MNVDDTKTPRPRASDRSECASAVCGYTLLLGSTGSLTINPILFKNIEFFGIRNLVPVGMIVSQGAWAGGVATASAEGAGGASVLDAAGRARRGAVAGEAAPMTEALDPFYIPTSCDSPGPSRI